MGRLPGVGKTQHPGKLHCQHEVQEEQRLGIQVTRHVTLLQSAGKKFRDKNYFLQATSTETHHLSVTYTGLDVLQLIATKPDPTMSLLLEQVTATGWENTTQGRGARTMLFEWSHFFVASNNTHCLVYWVTCNHMPWNACYTYVCKAQLKGTNTLLLHISAPYW